MKRRHCLIDRRLQTAEALFILLQPAELNTLYLSPQLSVRLLFCLPVMVGWRG